MDIMPLKCLMTVIKKHNIVTVELKKKNLGIIIYFLWDWKIGTTRVGSKGILSLL